MNGSLRFETQAELQLTLTRELEGVAKQAGEKPLMACLEKHFDAKWLHFMAKLAQDVSSFFFLTDYR